jgi:hypothetical protein
MFIGFLWPQEGAKNARSWALWRFWVAEEVRILTSIAKIGFQFMVRCSWFVER